MRAVLCENINSTTSQVQAHIWNEDLMQFTGFNPFYFRSLQSAENVILQNVASKIFPSMYVVRTSEF
jgi:hypothetical protein